MRIQKISLFPYQIPLKNKQVREGVLINILDHNENSGWGEIAPLPTWSQETLEEALAQLIQEKQALLNQVWEKEAYLKELAKLNLYPSVAFGIESALLAILDPFSSIAIPASALFMGTCEEIMQQAALRQAEGFTSAKLKVGHLTFREAESMIASLKDCFRLRIDVNRAWNTKEALAFFSQYAWDTFDYVEEPFQNPHDLRWFELPLAVDESFPCDLTLGDLEKLPTLKAIIYKPTIQGGMVGCQDLQKWAFKKSVQLVLSSSFESDIGLAHVALMAKRLSACPPVGLGTYHYLIHDLSVAPLQFSGAKVQIPAHISPNLEKLTMAVF
ncbi:o-succinylbenzoate synthase [Parachlamydia sp. AcF125]|uniref:o-succinylbenzoate synthase n=1 Tax=Parachlamydia sp. AcF125 TaxID=2795736 RepID=UPI001BC94E3C|nr:o-succinylbenzoate synthase [Parachlamydia sp. AcF125]MBS4168020.1 o-succinylbenzoate synthase [Parachlamydia sp. AcF125]